MCSDADLSALASEMRLVTENSDTDQPRPVSGDVSESSDTGQLGLVNTTVDLDSGISGTGQRDTVSSTGTVGEQMSEQSTEKGKKKPAVV